MSSPKSWMPFACPALSRGEIKDSRDSGSTLKKMISSPIRSNAMAMVTTRTLTLGALISGRMKIRSIKSPRTTVAATARTMPTA